MKPLFRAKALSGEWVQGNFIHSKRFEGCFNEYRIYDQETGMEHDVDPETVGQYTGLVDKNRNKIFEDDILSDEEYESWEWRGVVKFSHGLFGAEWLANEKRQDMLGMWGQLHNLRRLDDGILDRKIVIGNIHDNPELL